MNKTKIKDTQDSQENYPLIPPEVHFLADKYLVKLPLSELQFEDPWDLRLRVAEILEGHLGDHVELTSLKVKKPHLLAKSAARFRRQPVYARAYATINF